MGGHGRSCSVVFYFLVMLAFYPMLAFSFSFAKFDEKDPVFASMVTLFGDVELNGTGFSVRLTRPASQSYGGVMFNRPVDLPAMGPVKVVAFTAGFSFSAADGRADGLAFLLVPRRHRRRVHSRPPPLGVFPGVVAVEFDTKLDSEVGDPSANHVGIDIGSLVSVAARNATEPMSSGEKLHAWVMYDWNSEELCVWMGKSAAFHEAELLISYHFALPDSFAGGFYVCLSSSSENSTTSTSVYSWDFNLRRIASTVHSEPLDPKAATNTPEPAVQSKRWSDPLPRVLGGMLLGAGCGVVVAVITQLSWSAVAERRRQVAPQVYPACPVEGGYEEIVLSGGKKVEKSGGGGVVDGKV